MLAPWLDLPGAEDLIGEFGEVAGLDLRRLGTTADAEEIKDTAVTQPLIVALGLLAGGRLDLRRTGAEVVLAGHSVGEITAAALAGVLRPAAAVAFAARRGAEMAAACALEATGMAAVLGGDEAEVLAAIEACGLSPANRNAAGQIVAAGTVDGLEKLAANAPAKARVRPLAVAGAFHTSAMAPAEVALADYAHDVAVAAPTHPLLSNADGRPVTDAAAVLAGLVHQVTRPVRWDLCQQTLAAVGITALIELAPAGALTGMAKRELPGVELLAIKVPADLERAQALLDALADSGTVGAAIDGQVGATTDLRQDGPDGPAAPAAASQRATASANLPATEH